MSTFSTILQLAGAVFQIIGVLMMANSYTSVVGYSQVLRLLASALLRGSISRAAIDLSELNRENRLSSLQGLAFIGVGFVFQAIGMLISLPSFT